MNDDFSEENINSVSSQYERFLRKIPKWSLKAFAFFTAAIMLLSALAGGDPPPINIDVNQELPWEHIYSPAPGGQWESLRLFNITHDMNLVIRFENVIVTSELKVNELPVGTLESEVTNIYVFQVLNGAEPILKFWATDGLHVKLFQPNCSGIETPSSAHVFGKTIYEHNSFNIIDLAFSDQIAKEMTIESNGYITYMGMTEFPEYSTGISRYGFIDNSVNMIKFPFGTKLLRLLSDQPIDFIVD